MAVRKVKKITDKKDIDELLNLKEEDIVLSYMIELFGEFDGKVRFNPYDEIDIPPGSYGVKGNMNTNTFTTTVGQWIYNKAFIEKNLFHVFGYVSSPINNGTYGDMNSQLTYALLEDKITLEEMKHYIMRYERLMPLVSIISPGLTSKMLLSTNEINKKKAELVKKYKKGLEDNDPLIASKMEKELLDYSRKLLNDDPSMDMYESGARGSFNNNFKNMFVMKGAVKDPDPTKGYNVLTSNYVDGISKEEYSKFANALAAGPYARSRKTMYGGHMEKLYIRAYGHIHLLPRGSDCGTTRTIEEVLTPKNVGLYMYSYIKEGSKLVELTSDNKDKYIGKKVKIRFSSLCESPPGTICNKCAGEFYYRIGIMNIGMGTEIVASKIKNVAMKSFHDSTLQYSELDPGKAFGY